MIAALFLLRGCVAFARIAFLAASALASDALGFCPDASAFLVAPRVVLIARGLRFFAKAAKALAGRGSFEEQTAFAWGTFVARWQANSGTRECSWFPPATSRPAWCPITRGPWAISAGSGFFSMMERRSPPATRSSVPVLLPRVSCLFASGGGLVYLSGLAPRFRRARLSPPPLSPGPWGFPAVLGAAWRRVSDRSSAWVASAGKSGPRGVLSF